MSTNADIPALYQSLLRRAPDPDALANCDAFLLSGGTVEQIRDEILRSEEYRNLEEDLTAARHERAMREDFAAAAVGLYQTLLQREPDAGALANCEAFRLAGGTIEELRAEILRSDEYRILEEKLAVPRRGRERARAMGQAFRTANPLSQIPELYQDEFLPFFTHNGRYRPIALVIETINICNNDCIICPYSQQTRDKQTMPLDLFEKVISDYAAIGGGALSLTPMTGELFLDKHLGERLGIIEKFPSVGPLSAITNGSMVHRFSDKKLAEIVNAFRRISISVYGLDADEYLTMTRKRSYGRMIDGIVRLLRVGGPDRIQLGIRHLKQRTAEEVNDWVGDLAARAGVPADKIRCAPTIEYANWSVFDTSKPLPFDARWTEIPDNKHQCALPLVSAQVLSDGTLSFCPCMDFNADSSLILGNLKDASLRELLDSPAVTTLMNWDENGVPKFCQSCTAHRPIDMFWMHPELKQDPLKFFAT